jgi:N6-adenosine-specific RNA methylase IME4
VWDKVRFGMGYHFRKQTEVLIYATRGDKVRMLRKNQKDIVSIPRTKHSEKPAEIRTMIESLSPGPRLELFARERPEGWDVWGNQA